MSAPSSSTDLQYLKGIGPRRAEVLQEHGIRSVRDLLLRFPFDYLDRSRIMTVRDLRKVVVDAVEVTVVANVVKVEARKTKKTHRMMFLLSVSDGTGTLSCVWFEGYRWLKDAFAEGEVLALSAVPVFDRYGKVQFVHPQFDRLASSEADEPDWGKLFNTGAIIPKYSSTAELTAVGLDSRGIRRIVRNALPRVGASISERLPASLVGSEQLLPIHRAVEQVHFPPSWKAMGEARKRLAFDELFFIQLMMHLRRVAVASQPGRRFDGPTPMADRLLASLPYQLTGAQRRVLNEITADMRSPRPMHRLLQGDVGSGKTVVALLACLRAIDHGAQAAFMAPTEVLAEQHAWTLRRLTEGLGINIRSLIGGQKKRLREDVLEDIHQGTANLIVGTHALLEGAVEFADLGFAVIDEQHRFGVEQRAALRKKGADLDVLVMTATPIPRTLAMSIYGDLDVSTIDEMPANRRSIRTAIRTEEQKGRVYEFVRSEVARGRQAYVVFPLIERSEKVDLKAATEAFDELRIGPLNGLRLALLHGRQPSEEKERVMRGFQEGNADVLVSTTVIEVGIDVPNATVMIVENAERFGLSQLHQLRGRVGRGADQSYCILVSNAPLYHKSLKGMDPAEQKAEENRAVRRLKTMEETTDGFKISEVDLELRGPGEFFGTRQSGAPMLTMADPIRDRDLLDRARLLSGRVVEADPHLRKPEHREIRVHFEEYYRDLFDLGSVG
ncbi:MAG: ATP-dependent DNA helicase RecG [Bacteroidetes bacterium]|jgi:ATP-dependent DNA helicase RecG|nr:ATP-dependent DNA helicase RecG [Bacteroidota bacterium]